MGWLRDKIVICTDFSSPNTKSLAKPIVINLTHWGRVTHMCVSKLAIIGSDNGLSTDRRRSFIWTNVGILLIWHLGTNFSEITIEIYTFSYKKMHLIMSSGKWRSFRLGLNVLTWGRCVSAGVKCVSHIFVWFYRPTFLVFLVCSANRYCAGSFRCSC